MAGPRVFLDSDILVYTDDIASPVKQSVAVQVVELHLRERSRVISVQVLQEYYAVSRAKLKVDHGTAREKIGLLSALTIFQPSIHDVLGALDLHHLHQVSFWDGMILRAALKSGCRTLLSEDMHHGRRIDGIEIVNPFLR